MGLRRLVVRHGAELRRHREIKQWSSCGVGALLMAVFLLVCTFQGARDVLVEPLDSGLDHRRLSCEHQAHIYPDDPIIPRLGNPPSYFNATIAEKFPIVVHIILVVYMLLGLNTICDIYFCGALDVMVDAWGVKPDVAGATFMAAGGSMPELFTSLIGAVILENDVGFSTIVGSAVFNVLAVIGACGMFAKKPIQLTWWPLFRDCTCYIIGLSLLAIFSYGKAETNSCGERVGGGGITFSEAVILFCAYLGYCVLMSFNRQIEAIVSAIAEPSERKTVAEGIAGDSIDDLELQVSPFADTEKDPEAVKPISHDNGVLKEYVSVGEVAPGPPEHGAVCDLPVQKPLSPLCLNSIAAPDEMVLGPLAGIVKHGALPTIVVGTKLVAPVPLPALSLNVPVGTECEFAGSGQNLVTLGLRYSASLDCSDEPPPLHQDALRKTAHADESLNFKCSRDSKAHHIAHHIRVVHSKAHQTYKDEAGKFIRDISLLSSGLYTPPPEAQEAERVPSPGLSPNSANSVVKSMPPEDNCHYLVACTPAADVPAPKDEPAALQESPNETEADSVESDDVVGLMIMPAGLAEKVIWMLSLPIYVPLYYCIPKPSPRWFMATFMISLFFIAGFSFVLVYCVELFGEAMLGGGDSVTVVMSFTVLAAGTSIPDLVSSMSVARAGEGDMAISSSIGSNLFDILVGLPVPWIIKIAMVEQNLSHTVRIRSPYIALYVLLLLFMVFCVVASIHMMGWKLSKSLGYAMAGLYFVFLAVVLPVELFNKGPYL